MGILRLLIRHGCPRNISTFYPKTMTDVNPEAPEELTILDIPVSGSLRTCVCSLNQLPPNKACIHGIASFPVNVKQRNKIHKPLFLCNVTSS